MKELFILIFWILSFSVKGQVTYQISFDDLSYKNFIFIDTVNYLHNIWQVGRPDKTVFTSAYSAPGAIVTDTVNAYPAKDTSVFILKCPAYSNWPGTPSWAPFYGLQFYYQLNIDSGTKIDIEVSEDTLGNWLDLKQNPLPYNYQHHIRWATDVPIPNLDSSTSGWTFFELVGGFNTFKISDTILFRFTFISNSNLTHKDGWIIDDMEMNYYFEAGVNPIPNDHLISIYPNPSKGKIYIHSNNSNTYSLEIIVYNTEGQQIYKTEQRPVSGYLDLQLPSGNYTLKYTSGDEYCVKKIVILK